MKPTTISSIPTKCNIWTKCQSDSDCNGGNCLPEFGPGGSGNFCSCNIKPLTKPLSTTLRSTPLFTTEIKCVNGKKCETDADCNQGNCFDFFGVPDRKFCKCDEVTSTPLIPTFNPSISNAMFCITNNQCETDEQCPGGKCKNHKTSGV